MNYVVTILTEKYLYRVNIEGGIKYTLGSGKKDLFPMSELGIDGQLGMFFNEKSQISSHLRISEDGSKFYKGYRRISGIICYSL